MKTLRWIYPSMVGLLLGSLQTGLYFQLSFTLSSSFTTFLMVTVCWLLGSAVGVYMAKRVDFPMNGFLALAVLAYFVCVALLTAAPFNTQLWPIYACFITLSGLYPGVFFVRLNDYYSARELFFKENNGFIVGLICGTIFFLMGGRIALLVIPVLFTGIIIVSTKPLLADGLRIVTGGSDGRG
jgi:hypothetical protein